VSSSDTEAVTFLPRAEEPLRRLLGLRETLLGEMAASSPAVSRALEMADTYLFLAISYFFRLTTLDGKVIFGSDVPIVHDLAANIDAVRRLPLPDGFADDMLGTTALALLGLAS